MVIAFKGRTVASRPRRLRDLLFEHSVRLTGVSFANRDIEGAERAVPLGISDFLNSCDRVAMEPHDGSGALLKPLVQCKGFVFRPLRRMDFFLALFRFLFRLPFQEGRICGTAREAQHHHGRIRLLKGLEVVKSPSLTVGTFVQANGWSGA